MTELETDVLEILGVDAFNREADELPARLKQVYDAGVEMCPCVTLPDPDDFVLKHWESILEYYGDEAFSEASTIVESVKTGLDFRLKGDVHTLADIERACLRLESPATADVYMQFLIDAITFTVIGLADWY